MFFVNKKEVRDLNYNKHLSETGFLETLDFNARFKISIEAPTGCGKSYYLLDYLKRNNIPFLYATDTLFLMEGLANRHGIPYYCAADRSKEGERQLITVYQHIPKFIRKGMTLIIDESHSLVTDYSWRRETVENTLTAMTGYDRVILLSGTPLLSNDSAYNGIEQVRAIPKEVSKRKLWVTRFSQNLEGAILQLAGMIKEEGYIPVLSLLDKSDKLDTIIERLPNHGFNKIAVINSLTNKKTRGKDVKGEGEMENDIEVEGDPGYYDQLITTGKVDADIIITTYRQGYDIKGDNYKLIIAPSKNRHSYTDIIQVMNRFRDCTTSEGYLLCNNLYEEQEFNYQQVYSTILNKITQKTRTEFNRIQTLENDYRAIKLDQQLNCNYFSRFIYSTLYMNHQKIANTTYNNMNNVAYNNLYRMKRILETFNIDMELSKDCMDLKEEIEPKEKKKYTQEEIDIAVDTFFHDYAYPKEKGMPVLLDIKERPIYQTINEYYETFHAIGVPSCQVINKLKRYLITPQKMKSIKKVIIIKFGTDPNIKAYRLMLLRAFNVGERLTSPEICKRINNCRQQVGDSILKEKTAVEFFNLLFKTKRVKMNVEGKETWGREIEKTF